MENHHFQWVNPLFLWPFSIAMLVYQRVLAGPSQLINVGRCSCADSVWMQRWWLWPSMRVDSDGDRPKKKMSIKAGSDGEYRGIQRGDIRLVGGLEHGFYFPLPSWDDDPIWRTHFSERLVNHQPVGDATYLMKISWDLNVDPWVSGNRNSRIIANLVWSCLIDVRWRTGYLRYKIISNQYHIISKKKSITYIFSMITGRQTDFQSWDDVNNPQLNRWCLTMAADSALLLWSWLILMTTWWQLDNATK